jgi:signal transduction histidine kinase
MNSKLLFNQYLDSELLHSRQPNLQKDEEILNVIIRNSKRLMKLADEILDVARIESGSLF